MSKQTSFWSKLTASDPFTWTAHAWITAHGPLPLVAGAKWAAIHWFTPFGSFAALALYAALIVCLCAFYVAREQADEEKHRALGDYDTGGARLTKRVDKVGDSLGPIVAAITITTGLVVMLEHWIWPVILFFATGIPMLLRVWTIYQRTKGD